MKGGAKVPAGVLFRVELDRIRVEPLRPRGAWSCERDWFRACAILLGDSASGEETRSDFGRDGLGVGPGEGEVGFRAKGLLRHRGPLGAGALMVSVVAGAWLPRAAHHAAVERGGRGKEWFEERQEK